MHKKDYEAIAAIIKKYEKHADWIPEKLADHFEADNAKFQRVKFLEGCGMQGID